MSGEPRPFRDAEAWLEARGIPREPVTRPEPPGPDPDAAGSRATPEGTSARPPEAPDRAEPGARETLRLARQAARDQQLATAERGATPQDRPGLEDDVARAVAFIRRSTSSVPQAEARLAGKLADRGCSPEVQRLALERARREGLVDDLAMAAALVEERRRAGHAPARLRRDLAARGFDEATLDAVLEEVSAEDQEAAAFAIASQRAGRLTGVDTQTAFRRVAAFVARRGYPEALARKVARAAVFASRDPERIAGR